MSNLHDSTAKHAKVLWSTESIRLRPESFQARFDELYRSAEGPATLWHLGGAASDYLRVHPGSIQVPEGLIEALLKSPIVDGRIIGRKLANRCSFDAERTLSSILDALNSGHESEICGGLFELWNLLERDTVAPMIHHEGLFCALANLTRAKDAYVRDSASRLFDRLKA
ncbi:hypothetical protein [Botrimarina sp.]|uniref:hypothetical protein n=1 Tax=Botrimarina sp. TaxID=2795802 RepID=UPI0032F010A8